MATAKAKTKKKTASKKSSFDLGKYIQDVKIGDFKLETVLEGNSKNMHAIAAANRAVIDGYTDVAKRQYEMLKELLDEIKNIGGGKSDTSKELKKLVDHAKKDVQTLQKMAKKTNADAQKIIKKRTEANVKAWKKVVADAKKKVNKKKPAAKKKASTKKTTAKKPAKKKAAAKKLPAKKS